MTDAYWLTKSIVYEVLGKRALATLFSDNKSKYEECFDPQEIEVTTCQYLTYQV